MTRKGVYSGLVILTFLVNFGCQNEAAQDGDVALMANLECQARQLKEQRFRVANQLRLRDDSLMTAKVSRTVAQIAEADSLKETLTRQTSALATRLTTALDSLFETQYKTKESREAFDRAMAQKVREICP